MCVYTIDEIAKSVRPIAEKYNIDEIYLFGSYARGEATEESDVDLFIVRPEKMGLKYCSMWNDFEEALQKKVDIVSQFGLYMSDPSPADRSMIINIERDRKKLYEAKKY